MSDILRKIAAYNAGLLAKFSSTGSASQGEGGIYLRATTAAPSAASEHGWIGGNPSLPDPFQWPERDGQLYQFLCQIDCASLPPLLWGGLGPRQGWLAVFAFPTDSLDVKLIYASGLGPERHNGAAWRKSASALGLLDSRLDRFLSAPPNGRCTSYSPRMDKIAFLTRFDGAPLHPVRSWWKRRKTSHSTGSRWRFC